MIITGGVVNHNEWSAGEHDLVCRRWNDVGCVSHSLRGECCLSVENGSLHSSYSFRGIRNERRRRMKRRLCHSDSPQAAKMSPPARIHACFKRCSANKTRTDTNKEHAQTPSNESTARNFGYDTFCIEECIKDINHALVSVLLNKRQFSGESSKQVGKFSESMKELWQRDETSNPSNRKDRRWKAIHLWSEVRLATDIVMSAEEAPSLKWVGGKKFFEPYAQCDLTNVQDLWA